MNIATPITRKSLLSWSSRLMTAGIVASLALSGCSDGDRGPKGDTGDAGPVNESGITVDASLTAADEVPSIVLTIVDVTGQTGANGNFQPGDFPVVTFTVEKDDGSAWYLDELESGRVWLSGPNYNYQPVIGSQRDVVDVAERVDDGTYRYTFATAIPETYGAPLNDTATYGAADGELQGQALLDGTYTVAMAIRWSYTVDGASQRTYGNATRDILVGPTAVLATREVVKLDNCNACHGSLQAHGGNYQDPKLCITCHTSGSEDAAGDDMTEFRVMIHKIHNGAYLPSVAGVTTDATGARDYTATPRDYIVDGRRSDLDASHIKFPVFPSMSYAMPRDSGYSALSSAAKAQEDTIRKGVVSCYKCHGDPDGSGPLTAPADGTHAITQQSRRACGSCHDDIVWEYPYTANTYTMPAQTDDSSCVSCHSSGWTTSAHAHPMADVNPITGETGYSNGATFAVTAMAGSTLSHFVAGEKPQITFTLTDASGADISIAQLNRMETTLVGPTDNRQLVFPLASPNGVTLPLLDFSGRLVAASTSGKGSMSRTVGSTASETLKVLFSSDTAFDVYAGSALAARGSGTLVTATNSLPSGASLSALELTSSAVAQDITVAFTSATDFTVTGSSSGAMGTGVLPNSTNGSIRFTSTDGSVAFTIATRSAAFAASDQIQFTVFATSSGGHIFAIVPGSTAYAAGDRYYYDTVDNSLTTYTYNLRMDIPTEFLGDGASGAAGETFTAGNLPVYWGHETVYERTAISGGSTALATAAAAQARYIDVAATTGFADGDKVVLGNGTATEEYLEVGTVIGTQVWFTTPLRYDHGIGVACEEVTLSKLFEGTNYTLDPTTGTITTVTALGVGNAVVVGYRTAGAFGWYRHAGDTRQDVYPSPINDSPALGQADGEWQGLAFQAGTYTASIWGELPIYNTRRGETQAYTYVANPGLYDFRYGSAGTVEPYDLIDTQGTCTACHEEVQFHGGHRKGVDNCLICHGTAGMEDWPDYASGTSGSTAGVTATFRTMLHKIHRGEDLANAATYTVKGYRGSPHTYEEVIFPVMPSGVKNCAVCHGEDNDAWKEPNPRTHAAQAVPTKAWNAVCSSCHDSTESATHIEAMTTGGGAESCATCHSPGQLNGVDNVHKDPPPAPSNPAGSS